MAATLDDVTNLLKVMNKDNASIVMTLKETWYEQGKTNQLLEQILKGDKLESKKEDEDRKEEKRRWYDFLRKEKEDRKEKKAKIRQESQRLSNDGGDGARFDGFIFAALTGITGITMAISGVLVAFEKMRDDLEPELQGLYSALTGFIATIGIRGYIGRVTEIMKGVLAVPLLVLNGVRSMLNGLIARVTAATSRVFNRGLFGIIGRTLRGIGRIGGFIMKGVRMVGGLITTLLPFIKPVLMFARMFAVFLGRMSGIFTIIIGVFGAVRAMWQEFQAGGDWIDIVRAAIEGFINTFLSIIGDLGVIFGWIAEKLLQFMGVSDESAAAVRNFIENMFNAIEDFLQSVVTWAMDINEWLARTAGMLLRFITGQSDLELGDVINHFISAFQAMGEKISEFFSWADRQIARVRNMIPWMRDEPDGDRVADDVNRAGNFRRRVLDDGTVVDEERRRVNRSWRNPLGDVEYVEVRRTAADGTVLSQNTQAVEEGRRMQAASAANAVVNAPSSRTTVNATTNNTAVGVGGAPSPYADFDPGMRSTGL